MKAFIAAYVITIFAGYVALSFMLQEWNPNEWYWMVRPLFVVWTVAAIPIANGFSSEFD